MTLRSKALSSKILVLGVDGMDPRLTKKYLDKGLLPNIERYLAQGAAREDLVLLGAVPTITPPMWTTLATGAYPNTHGITCFWKQHADKIDTYQYALDSKNCKAEPLWNVFAEADKKTLVFHWPGSSWPPTSDNPNLSVIEGTQPSAVNYGIGIVDQEYLFVADQSCDEYHTVQKNGVKISGVGCVVDDMEIDDGVDVGKSLSMPEPQPISMNPYEGECQNYGQPPYLTYTPLEKAKGWEQAPQDAMEFSIMLCSGKIRRICLVTKNDLGLYDQVAVYRSKKDKIPMAVLHEQEYLLAVKDDLLDKEDNLISTTRSITAFDIAPDGSHIKLWLGNANKIECDTLFHPKALYKEVINNVGFIPSVDLQLNLAEDPHLLEYVMNTSWRHYGDWQAAAINYLIQAHDFDVVFSHYHNLDNFGHVYWEAHNTFGDQVLDNRYETLFEQVYKDTDKYLGEFLHLLDKGWTILITSDHGLLCKEESNICPGLGDAFVINTTIMRELGYTVMKRDENGRETREIDYSKTKAVASRGNHIYINLKSRYEYGIVEDSEKYALEKRIIDDLYSYRNQDGKRIVGLAIRNQEGALLGLSGSECGDILYWLEEGFNRLHGDSLSTIKGHADTSVSPIFIIAGQGVKHNFYTERVIRQVDVAPTLAIIGGVRMPAQCEGAPVYQILAEEL